MLIITQRIRRVCEDMCRRIPELRHIDMNRVAIGSAQCKKQTKRGVLATTYELFDELVEDGERWIQPPFLYHGKPTLYVIRFFMPRFMLRPGWQRLRLIVHELYHISPDFDGWIREIDGSRGHGAGGEGVYNRKMSQLLKYWLEARRDAGVRNNLYDFLYMTPEELENQYGVIYGEYYPVPYRYLWDGIEVVVEPELRPVWF